MTRPTGSIVLTRRQATALTLSLALGGLAACGGDDDGGDGGSAASSSSPRESSAAASSAGSATPTGSTEQGGGTLEITSVDFSFELPSEELAAGEYTIELTNGGNATHDLVVERDGEDVAGTDQIGPGESASVDVTLEPGEYVFYCSVANHRAMGMEVTVTVT